MWGEVSWQDHAGSRANCSHFATTRVWSTCDEFQVFQRFLTKGVRGFPAKASIRQDAHQGVQPAGIRSEPQPFRQSSRDAVVVDQLPVEFDTNADRQGLAKRRPLGLRNFEHAGFEELIRPAARLDRTGSSMSMSERLKAVQASRAAGLDVGKSRRQTGSGHATMKPSDELDEGGLGRSKRFDLPEIVVEQGVRFHRRKEIALAISVPPEIRWKMDRPGRSEKASCNILV